LKGVDAHRLVLYKVALPYADDLEESVSQALKEELENPLSELSEIFLTNPPEEEISILVEIPDISE
jgi:hypothetical protein